MQGQLGNPSSIQVPRVESEGSHLCAERVVQGYRSSLGE